jgi:Ser/Thr protein kinase RdoA (MazF antagonist)
MPSRPIHDHLETQHHSTPSDTATAQVIPASCTSDMPHQCVDHTDQPFDFSALSPDTVLDACEQLGIYADSGLLPLNSYENRVFQFRADDKQRYVVKFYRPQRWSWQQIEEEHLFLQELAAQNLAVAAPLQRDGRSLFQHEGYAFCLYPSIGGRPFDSSDEQQLLQCGQLLGLLHHHGAKQPFQHRSTLALQQPMQMALAHLRQTHSPLPDQPLPSYDVKFAIPPAIASQLWPLIERLIAECAAYDGQWQSRRLHGDCHAGNILQQDNGLVFLDFDDCIQGPAVADFWLLLHGEAAEQQLQLELLLEDYQLSADFDHAELALIEPLRCHRMITYMAWLSKRRHDAAFVQHFPWFGSPDYWQQQLVQLQQQLQRLQAPPLQLHQGNSVYFYD